MVLPETQNTEALWDAWMLFTQTDESLNALVSSFTSYFILRRDRMGGNSLSDIP